MAKNLESIKKLVKRLQDDGYDIDLTVVDESDPGKPMLKLHKRNGTNFSDKPEIRDAVTHTKTGYCAYNFLIGVLAGIHLQKHKDEFVAIDLDDEQLPESVCDDGTVVAPRGVGSAFISKSDLFLTQAGRKKLADIKEALLENNGTY